MSIEFIGRQRELDGIKSVVTSQGTQILCIQGLGGVGKTRLLVQVQKECDSIPKFHIGDIIDFDDPRFHLPDSIGQEIAHQLGGALFQSYSDELQHKRFLEKHKASPEYLARQSRVIESEFLRAYGRVASGCRILLRFDATDNLRGLSAPLEYIAWLTKVVPNTCILVAGRDSTRVLEMMGVPESECANKTLDLDRLSEEECQGYLREKLDQRMITMSPEMMDKLIFLSRGRIILLDMAVEWLLKEKSPQWLQDLQVESAIRSSDEEHEVFQKFESRLFDHVRDLRDSIDRLVLLLSKVYPLDKEGLRKLLNLSDEDTEVLLARAETLTFIKKIPDGYIKLHDEAERMMNLHVWPRLPPKRAQYTSEAAINYLKDRSERLLKEIGKLESLELEHRFYTFRILQLRHLLNLDVEMGFEAFQVNWDLAEKQFKSTIFQGMLLDELLPFLEILQPGQQAEVALRQADRLLNKEQYHMAINEYLDPLLEKLLSQEDCRRVHALIRRGKAYIRLGHVEQGISDLQDAVKLSQQLRNAEWEIRAKMELGQLQRLAGDLDKAAHDYLGVLRQTLEIGDKEKQASVQGDLAYLKALQGESEPAIHLIEQALQIWRQFSEENQIFYEGLGRAYYTAGLVYREIDRGEKALDYFGLSWDVLLTLGLEEWRSNIRAGRGIAYWILGRYADAEADLRWALEHSTRASAREPRYYLAHLKWAQGDRRLAEQMFRQCVTEAQEYGDAFHELQVLCALTRLAFEHGMEHLATWQDFENRHATYRDHYPRASFPAMEGIFYSHLGHLAVKQKDFQEAIELYKRGLPQLAAARHKPYYRDFGLYAQFSFIHNKVTRLLGPEKTRTLGKELELVWSQQELDISHPETTIFFFLWKQGSVPRGLR